MTETGSFQELFYSWYPRDLSQIYFFQFIGSGCIPMRRCARLWVEKKEAFLQGALDQSNSRHVTAHKGNHIRGTSCSFLTTNRFTVIMLHL